VINSLGPTCFFAYQLAQHSEVPHSANRAQVSLYYNHETSTDLFPRSINWLLSVSEIHCVYHVLNTDSFNIIEVNLIFRGSKASISAAQIGSIQQE